MNTLPDELLAAICEQCDHASLKTLRLVQRRLGALSTPAVFEHFFSMPTGHPRRAARDSADFALAALIDLSKSPTLSKHVRRVTVYSDILPAWSAKELFEAIDYRPSFSSWYALVALGQSNGQCDCRRAITTSHDRRDYLAEYKALPRHHLSQADFELAWNAFLDVRSEQRNWNQRQHGAMMKEALTSLPNLVEANVKSTAPFTGKTNDWAVWKALRRIIKVGPDDWRYSTDHFDVEYANASGCAALALIEAVGFRANFHGVKPVSKLLFQSSHVGSLEGLHRYRMTTPPVGHSVPQSPPTTSTDFVMSSTSHQMRLDAFRSLVVLKLHIPFATLSTRLDGFGLQRETMAFLRTAIHLKDLDLRYTDDELSPDDEVPQLEALFSQGLVWPDIERLVLATNISAEVLLGFLSRHSATIRELELRDMLLSGVQHALNELPSVVSLQHVYAECLWDYSPEGEFLSVLSRSTDHAEPYEQAMKAYLVGKSTRMPLLEWDGARGSEVGLYDDEDLFILPLASDEEMSDAVDM